MFNVVHGVTERFVQEVELGFALQFILNLGRLLLINGIGCGDPERRVLLVSVGIRAEDLVLDEGALAAIARRSKIKTSKRMARIRKGKRRTAV